MKRSTILKTVCIFAICVGAVDAKSKKNASNAAIVKYPLTTCIITDNDLGSMGDPISKIYNGQEVKFCCNPCIAEFEKNPEVYLKKMKESATKSTPAEKK